MTAISERIAKHHHIWIGGEILAYSLKVASTYIFAHATGAKITARRDRYKTRKLGQAEAIEARDVGTNVHLIVRHPLDRLVSNYVFWTKKANSCIKDILEADAAAHRVLMGTDNPTIEQWTEAAHAHYNGHWGKQWDYHTTPEGLLVPNVLWPMESLDKMPATNDDLKNKSPRDKPSWEDYFTSSFRDEMEDYYAKDIELYEKSKENWSGQAPTILLSPR